MKRLTAMTGTITSQPRYESHACPSFFLNWNRITAIVAPPTIKSPVNEVFRFFGLLTTGLFIVGGATICFIRFQFRKNVGHAWDSYRGWLVMVPVIAVSLFIGRAGVICFFTAVAIAAFTEFARATGLHRDVAMTFASLAGIVGIGAVALARDPATG